jgi:hypothetical protein
MRKKSILMIIVIVKKKWYIKEKTKWGLKLIILLKFIIDKFVVELENIIAAYNYNSTHFLFITKLNCSPDSDSEVQESINNCTSTYKNDVDISLEN